MISNVMVGVDAQFSPSSPMANVPPNVNDRTPMSPDSAPNPGQLLHSLKKKLSFQSPDSPHSVDAQEIPTILSPGGMNRQTSVQVQRPLRIPVDGVSSPLAADAAIQRAQFSATAAAAGVAAAQTAVQRATPPSREVTQVSAPALSPQMGQTSHVEENKASVEWQQQQALIQQLKQHQSELQKQIDQQQQQLEAERRAREQDAEANRAALADQLKQHQAEMQQREESAREGALRLHEADIAPSRAQPSSLSFADAVTSPVVTPVIPAPSQSPKGVPQAEVDTLLRRKTAEMHQKLQEQNESHRKRIELLESQYKRQISELQSKVDSLMTASNRGGEFEAAFEAQKRIAQLTHDFEHRTNIQRIAIADANERADKEHAQLAGLQKELQKARANFDEMEYALQSEQMAHKETSDRLRKANDSLAVMRHPDAEAATIAALAPKTGHISLSRERERLMQEIRDITRDRDKIKDDNRALKLRLQELTVEAQNVRKMLNDQAFAAVNSKEPKVDKPEPVATARRAPSPSLARRPGVEVSLERKQTAERMDQLLNDTESLRTENKTLKARIAVLTTELRSLKGESAPHHGSGSGRAPSPALRRPASPGLARGRSPGRTPIAPLVEEPPASKIEYPARLIANLEQQLAAARRELERSKS
eukprot:TRINITY_DN1103_c0_g2_i1.p2 TRINITY_DN1103_c0_g2~~TRINITY_DN1103_c0_g2_i1.p2  ORF type:complete len:651 (-),score=144.83 TRINITY_DN1103_c0_g2_i1:1937-3889(-)